MPDRQTARPRLALAIPTYRRAEILAANLARMEDELRRLGVAVYVSDDSPDDQTERALARFDFVHYRRNDPPLRHDANLISTLTWPDADFVWLLGDSHWVLTGQSERILAFLGEQDLLMVNVHSKKDRHMLQEQCGVNATALLRNMLWHQTLTGATIYHQRVCDWIRAQGTALLVKRDFPQLSAMLGYATCHETCVGWFGEPSLGSVPKTSYWVQEIFTVFVDRWSDAVEAYPVVIPPRERASVIRSHSKNQKLFNLMTMLDLRLSGDYTWKRFADGRFRNAMHLSPALLIAVLLVPCPLIGLAKQARRRLGLSSR